MQRTDQPDDAPEHCPGTTSEKAGMGSACDGCPNQAACASGAGRAVDPALALVADRMSLIKHTVLVLSGKGGVGKSTFAAQLAFSLAASGKHVGVLDVDITGPSIPRMLGLVGASVHKSGSGWSPVYVEDNLCVMSIGFMLPDDDAAIVWRGPKKNGLIKQFLTDVEWGELDYLIIGSRSLLKLFAQPAAGKRAGKRAGERARSDSPREGRSHSKERAEATRRVTKRPL